jgi:acyl carrier protein
MEQAEIEQVVARIWRKALQVEELRPESSFYELGGDSILMMNILARIRSELGIELDEEALLFASTFQEFSAAVVAVSARGGHEQEIAEGTI